MSTATLEKTDFEQWEAELPVDTKKGLGAVACSGCPFLQKCPGKQDVTQACPPEAREIAAEQVSSALFDDSIGAILPMSGGGFAVLPEKASIFQTAIFTSKVNPKPIVKMKPSVEAKKSQKPERRRRDKRLGLLATRGERRGRERKTGLMAVLGELAVIFFGGTPTELAKK